MVNWVAGAEKPLRVSVTEGTVAVRTRAGGDQGAIKLDAFVAAALDEVRTKRA